MTSGSRYVVKTAYVDAALDADVKECPCAECHKWLYVMQGAAGAGAMSTCPFCPMPSVCVVHGGEFAFAGLVSGGGLGVGCWEHEGMVRDQGGGYLMTGFGGRTGCRRSQGEGSVGGREDCRASVRVAVDGFDTSADEGMVIYSDSDVLAQAHRAVGVASRHSAGGHRG